MLARPRHTGHSSPVLLFGKAGFSVITLTEGPLKQTLLCSALGTLRL